MGLAEFAKVNGRDFGGEEMEFCDCKFCTRGQIGFSGSES